MQRKQQVGECWVCVIFFARVVVSESMHGHVGGLRGGVMPPNFFFLIGTAFLGPHYI
jgi:hypothetical protein